MDRCGPQTDWASGNLTWGHLPLPTTPLFRDAPLPSNTMSHLAVTNESLGALSRVRSKVMYLKSDMSRLNLKKAEVVGRLGDGGPRSDQGNVFLGLGLGLSLQNNTSLSVCVFFLFFSSLSKCPGLCL